MRTAMKKAMMRLSRVVPAILLGSVFLGPAQAQAPAGEWKPSRSLEWIVSSGPGAALDMAARQIREAADRSGKLEHAFLVHNRPGGSNLIALNTLIQNPGILLLTCATSQRTHPKNNVCVYSDKQVCRGGRSYTVA